MKLSLLEKTSILNIFISTFKSSKKSKLFLDQVELWSCILFVTIKDLNQREVAPRYVTCAGCSITSESQASRLNYIRVQRTIYPASFSYYQNTYFKFCSLSWNIGVCTYFIQESSYSGFHCSRCCSFSNMLR